MEFLNGISGTFENTSHLAYVVNNAQKKSAILNFDIVRLT